MSGIIGVVLTGIYISPRITSTVLAASPLTLVAGFWVQYQTSQRMDKQFSHYAKSGTIVSEAFRNIRTIAALTSETIEIEQYETTLGTVESANTMVPVPTNPRTSPESACII